MSYDETSLALSTVALVPAVFSGFLPPLARVRGAKDHHGHLAAAETNAVVVSATVVLAVAAGTRSRRVAGVGLVTVAAYAFLYANARKHR